MNMGWGRFSLLVAPATVPDAAPDWKGTQMAFASRTLRRGAFAVAAAAAFVNPASALAAHNVIEPISVAPDGAIGNGSSVVGDHLGDYGDMTPDGRFVVFASAASNLVPGDTNGVGDVFVRDRRSGVTERVSVGPKGVEGNGDSNFLGLSTAPAISDDGRYVAFKSEASNLAKRDRNDLTDVFVHDRAAGTTEKISGDGGGDNPGISPDGNFVAFETFDFDDDFARDIYLRDRATGTIERISVSHDGSEMFSPSEDPVVAQAPNGRPIVAFASGAPNLVPNDGINIDVFVRDLSGSSPATELVSVASDEQPAGEFDTSRDPAITPDGSFVAFESDALNFTAEPQTTFGSDIFVRDRLNGTTVLASPNGRGREASGQSEDPEISADGRFVAFASFASDLIRGASDPDGELVRDAFVRDVTLESTEMISVNGAHEDATRDGFHDDVGAGPVSADGLVTMMGTQADNLFAGDTNGLNDVYVSDRRPAADLSLDKADAPDPVAPRATLTYTLVATNNGPNAAPEARLADTLPVGVTFASASPGCVHSAGKVECALGTLASGASAPVTITVTPKAPGVITNIARVGSSAPDPNPSSNTATTETTVAR
jgi:uncharacterized repeat protein (TIGR01451 family)